MPSAQDYKTVGHLYRSVRHGIALLAHQLGERVLFCGDPASQLGPDDVSLSGISVITDLATAGDRDRHDHRAGRRRPHPPRRQPLQPLPRGAR
ncbi:MAG: hypothetical protein WDN31_12070 [Hyphomicrobium sp.]